MDTIPYHEQIKLQNRLRDWVNQQPGPITVEEAAEFLGMPQDADGTYYAIPTIGRALERLGCEKEVLIHFWPPSAKLAQQPPQPTDKAELQEVINIIRDWVLSQTDEFAIHEIYRKPDLHKDLQCNMTTIKLIHKALLALRCTPIDRCGCVINDGRLPHKYNPPNQARQPR